MVVSNDDRLAELCRSYANQGRSAMGAWLQHDRLGQNYRLGEMAAALGRSQLARLDHFIDRRAAVARAYAEGLAALPGVRPPVVRPDVRMSWFVYVVTLEEGCDPGGFTGAVAELLADEGIGRPLLRCAVPDHLVQHGDQARLMDEQGLSVAALHKRILAFASENT